MSIPGLSYRLILLLAICAVLPGCGGGSSPGGPPPPPPHQKDGFVYNGLTHISFQPTEYTSANGTPSRNALAATGASWAGVLVTEYQVDATSTSITPDFLRTPTDNDVITAIQELHAKGLKVMLKPHVDAESGEWRGTFVPSDLDAWFTSYTNFIVHYAILAHDNNAEMFCVGTEFVQLSGAGNLTRWTNVITAIRAVYSGPLVYAANATFGGDEFTSVSFWDQLDLLGLDAYFPLTNSNSPTQSQLVSAWSSNKNGENIVAAVQNFSGAHPGKPLIFTEIGYRSVDGANIAPYDFSVAGAVDNGEQRDCYEAMFEVWSLHNSFMKGVFWWSWSVPPPGANDTDYNPRSKPAETVLHDWQ